ncbi:MAG: hypothetical protein ACMG57_03425, partial [Candidatus Dojkabacteria bacterium]
NSVNPTPNPQPTPTPVVSTPTITPTPTPVPSTSNLPDGWTMVNSSACNVDFPTPPNVAPYIEPIPAAGLTKIWETVDLGSSMIFTKGTSELLRFPGGVNGSDAPTPGVNVRCLPNATSSEGPGILAYLNTNAQAIGGSAVLQKTIEMWGVSNVYVITLNFGQTSNETGYLLVKDNTGYYVTLNSYPYDSQYNTYAQTIFDNLKFN